MDEESVKKKDIILEFCRSQGAPTAYALARLSAAGQRECIRQWIIKSRNPEIRNQTEAVAEQLYEQSAGEDPFFYDALSAEELEDRIEQTKRYARQHVNEQLRYGAICIDEINSPRPWVEYNQYHDLCDREWQVMVDGKSRSSFIQEFLDLPWHNRLLGILLLAFVGLDGILGIFGKSARGLLSLAIAYGLILTSVFLLALWLTSIIRRGSRG
jgi:hypothetical protein